jgi:nucleotide-binding universal stress UspA family protein
MTSAISEKEHNMRILIALDSSSYASEIIEDLGKRIWSKDSEFRVISVIKSTENWEIDQQYLHPCKLILDERVESLKKRIPDAKSISGQLLEGDARASILKEAREWQADLIVIGSHGDTGARRESVGSVAAAIVNEAPCSVEVVKVKTKTLQTV